MCGLLFSNDASISRQQFSRVLSLMHHRGPDSQSCDFSNPPNKLGHDRLKVLDLDKIVKKNYDNVLIQMQNDNNLEKLYAVIKEKGNSKIKICMIKGDKNYLFELKDRRKFDYETLKYLNKEHYIKKISL